MLHGYLLAGDIGVRITRGHEPLLADRFQCKSRRSGPDLFFILVPTGIFMFLTGRLLERWKPGRFMGVGVLICASATVLLPLAWSFTCVYAWASIMSASTALIYMSGLTVVQIWFPERRGLVSGLFNMSFAVSAALLSPVYNFILDAFGSMFSVTAPLVGDCFGMDHFGSIIGLIFTAYGFVTSIIGPWFTGRLLDITGGNFTVVFSYLGTLMLSAVIFVQITKPQTDCVLPVR